MEDLVAHDLAKLMKKPAESENVEAFERAFELTKAYAGSANAQSAAIPVVFEKLFELFATGRSQG